VRVLTVLTVGFVATAVLVGCSGRSNDVVTATTTAPTADASTPTPQVKGRWVLTDLGTFGGKGSVAADINDRGQIVGFADTTRRNEAGVISHGFLWQDGRLRDLGTLHGNDSSYAEAINERGQIVGYSSSTEDDYGVLWQNEAVINLGSLGWCCTQAHDITERGQIVGSSTLSRTGFRGDL
jgi:probable HAF family extracellular repeat protein